MPGFGDSQSSMGPETECKPVVIAQHNQVLVRETDTSSLKSHRCLTNSVTISALQNLVWLRQGASSKDEQSSTSVPIRIFAVLAPLSTVGKAGRNCSAK